MRTRLARLLVVPLSSVLSAGAAAVAAAQPPRELLHPTFQDHAVLQRDRPIRIWGKAQPGESITVTLERSSAVARADSSGRWSATLPAFAAGGPYVLAARTGTGAQQSVSDVLIGDVWLCAGQSNMVLEVRRTLDSRSEIANSANDAIRLFKVGQAASATPLDRFPSPGVWEVASPRTVPEWSAACFYFARELQKTMQVPMGLVNASWGGANIRAFMSEAAIRTIGGYQAGLDLLRLSATDTAATIRRWGSLWEEWWRSRSGTPAGDEPWGTAITHAEEWRVAPDALGNWERWNVAELAAYNGMVWYRTSVRLTAEQAGRAATLSLGPIDEIDTTWVNGILVGATSGPDTDREYGLLPGTLRPGENVIVVNVLDTYGNGGIYGPKEKRALRLAGGFHVPLAGAWFYRLVPARVGPPPRMPWEATGGLTTIYNGMIAPIGHYGLRGVVWYQGESNTQEADTYETLLTGLMADWRSRFGANLPFLIVQLANYGPPHVAPVDSGAARVREAQRRVATQDAHAGLAVTIDLGNPRDIHPADKQELGRRLARAARHVVFGEAVPPSGPVPIDARRDSAGKDIVVTFGDVGGRLVSYSSNEPIGFELCDRTRDSCRFARATIGGTRVTLGTMPGEAPTHVRFCWADSPVCTLFDESGLPAGPFEVAIQRTAAERQAGRGGANGRGSALLRPAERRQPSMR